MQRSKAWTLNCSGCANLHTVAIKGDAYRTRHVCAYHRVVMDPAPGSPNFVDVCELPTVGIDPAKLFDIAVGYNPTSPVTVPAAIPPAAPVTSKHLLVYDHDEEVPANLTTCDKCDHFLNDGGRFLCAATGVRHINPVSGKRTYSGRVACADKNTDGACPDYYDSAPESQLLERQSKKLFDRQYNHGVGLGCCGVLSLGTSYAFSGAAAIGVFSIGFFAWVVYMCVQKVLARR